MPVIQRLSFEQAQQHAQVVENHGLAFVEMASNLEGRLLTQEQAEFIKHAGQQIQHHGEIMRALAEQSLWKEQYSPQAYALVTQQQVQAALLYIEVIRVISQKTQPLL